MTDRKDLESERLNEAAARKLLERATELDARLATESSVADLRDAARAAGISEEAFNRALAEVRHDVPAVAVTPPFRRDRAKRRVVMALIAVLVAGLGLAFIRRVAPIERAQDARSAAPAAPTRVPPTAAPTPTPTVKRAPTPTKTAPPYTKSR